jgi:hypothetical protein
MNENLETGQLETRPPKCKLHVSSYVREILNMRNSDDSSSWRIGIKIFCLIIVAAKNVGKKRVYEKCILLAFVFSLRNLVHGITKK